MLTYFSILLVYFTWKLFLVWTWLVFECALDTAVEIMELIIGTWLPSPFSYGLHFLWCLMRLLDSFQSRLEVLYLGAKALHETIK